jgi:hypothetical protein
VKECHLPFSLYNQKHQLVLTDHIAIHLLQLPQWESTGTITSEKDRWIYLFKEGKEVDSDNPPETLNTGEMRQAMNVLHRFSENEADYLLYQSRMDAVLKENTYINELEEAMKAKEQAVKEKEKLAKTLAREKEQAAKKLAKEKEQAAKKLAREKEQAAKELAREKEQTAQAEKEKDQVAKEKEKLTKELAREKEQAQKKLNDLLLLLEKKGIDPDNVK